MKRVVLILLATIGFGISLYGYPKAYDSKKEMLQDAQTFLKNMPNTTLEQFLDFFRPPERSRVLIFFNENKSFSENYDEYIAMLTNDYERRKDEIISLKKAGKNITFGMPLNEPDTEAKDGVVYYKEAFVVYSDTDTTCYINLIYTFHSGKFFLVRFDKIKCKDNW